MLGIIPELDMDDIIMIYFMIIHDPSAEKFLSSGWPKTQTDDDPPKNRWENHPRIPIALQENHGFSPSNVGGVL